MEWETTISRIPTHARHFPARVSIPIPRGTAEIKDFSVLRPDGRDAAAQARTIVAWPDGSQRWVQLDFEATGIGQYRIKSKPSRKRPHNPISLENNKEGKTNISVGNLTVTLSPCGRSPVERILWNGKVLLDDSAQWSYAAVREDGEVFLLRGDSCRNLRIECEGAHRFQMAWETDLYSSNGEPLLEVRLRAEFLAGIEGFSLSFQFFNKVPRSDYLDIKSISCLFAFLGLGNGSAVVVQRSYGNLGLRRFVRTEKQIPIILDRKMHAPYVEDPRILGDDFRYPYFLERTNQAVEGAVALESKNGAVVCAMRDFVCQRPKTMDVSPGEIRFGIWPERAGMLHLPQGRSNRQTFYFSFMEQDELAVNEAIVDADRHTIEPVHAWLDKEDSKMAGDTWDQFRLFDNTDEGAGIFSFLLTSGTARYQTIPEMFHYGDAPDIGYTREYPAVRVSPVNAEPVPFGVSSGGSIYSIFQTKETLEPVWSNNEYDAIYCLALETLRTQSEQTLARLRAAARHQIEVDFVHYSDYWQHHRSTPAHGYDHVASAASIASHQWTQGLYYYYALTGDDDVPEVVQAICEYDIAFFAREELSFNRFFNREYGWGLLALVFGYELTGNQKYAAAAHAMIQDLVKWANKAGHKALGIGGPFAPNTVLLGVKSYHQATGEEDTRDILLNWVNTGMQRFNDRSGGPKVTELFVESMTYAWELTGNRKYLEDSMWQFVLMMHGYNAVGWVPTSGEALTTKLYARIYRGLVHYVSACAKAGLLKELERRVLGG